MPPSLPAVDLVLDCYERTFRTVLQKSFVEDVVRQNQFSFAHIFILINNVEDPPYAQTLAQALKDQGLISDYFFVADYLDAALVAVGLKRNDLGRFWYYTSCDLVALYICRSEYLLSWDADVRLVEPHDWLTPSLHFMQQNKGYLIANPLWSTHLPDLENEALSQSDNFYIGYGFSDQLYLVKKADLLKPVYKHWHVHSLRYPIAYMERIFETRIDSYMRCKQLLRLNYRHATYIHNHASTKAFRPQPKFFGEKVRQVLGEEVRRHYEPYYDPRTNTLSASRWRVWPACAAGTGMAMLKRLGLRALQLLPS